MNERVPLRQVQRGTTKRGPAEISQVFPEETFQNLAHSASWTGAWDSSHHDLPTGLNTVHPWEESLGWSYPSPPDLTGSQGIFANTNPGNPLPADVASGTMEDYTTFGNDGIYANMYWQAPTGFE